MVHPVLLPTLALLHSLTLGSALSIPASGSASGLTLSQSGSTTGTINVGNLTLPPTFGAGAHWYFTPSESAPISPLNVVNGVPESPTFTTRWVPQPEDSYAYRFGVQNLSSIPQQVFSKYDLARNLFQDQFILTTQVPVFGSGPKTPYPAGHYSGQKYPNTLPGKIEMYLDPNPVGYGMWYQDISFILKCLFDAEIGNPEKGGLGHFKFEFQVMLNQGPEWHRGVHGYFLPA